MRKILKVFAENHILANFTVVLVIAFAFYLWGDIPKEEMPETTADVVFVSAQYTGGTPEEIEYFLTKKIEEAVRGIEGIDEINSTSSNNSVSVLITLEMNYPYYDDAVTAIRDAVQRVDLPEDVEDEPRVREVKSTNRSVVQIALFHKEEKLLSVKGRQEVQDAGEMLEKRLRGIPFVNDVSFSGNEEESINVYIRPEALSVYEISYSDAVNTLSGNNVRRPLGTVKNEDDARVTIRAELDSEQKIRDSILQGSFSGRMIRIGDVADVETTFEHSTSVLKFNGHQALNLNVRKTSDSGITEASDAIRAEVESFFASSMRDSNVDYLIYSDSAESVRDRLILIRDNGIFGFALILLFLFIFMNFTAGFWVAMGIPFSLCFSVIVAHFLGYSVNNMTLSGIVIVLGMVVDDSIVISENITRLKEEGASQTEAAVEGTATVILPVLASILTTCVAFIPLYYFSGSFGKMIEVIPAMIFAMLGGSLLEAVFILPSHMNLRLPELFRRKATRRPHETAHWFRKVEDAYGRFLEKVLRHTGILYASFAVLLTGAIFLFLTQMSFALSPREETNEIFISGFVDQPRLTSAETAVYVEPLEEIIDPYLGSSVGIYSTRIASSRRGSDTNQNYFSIRIEMLPSLERELSNDELVAAIEAEVEKQNLQYADFYIAKSRFGASSDSGGSPIVIEIQENDDARRNEIAEKLCAAMDAYEFYQNAEIEEPVKSKQYIIDYDRELIQRLSISSSEISNSLRTIIQGSTVFYHYRDDIEIPVKVTLEDKYVADLPTILHNPISTRQGYLVPLETVVKVRESMEPNYITRVDEKRVVYLYADLASDKITPIETAEYFEQNVFPDLMAQYPTCNILFRGEVESTRESSGDILYGSALVIFLIYFILSLLFNSLWKPFIIVAVIPFGMMGVVYALMLHNMPVISFFTAIGILGLAGVVVNDSIVMLDKLLNSYRNESQTAADRRKIIADISKTRLRAVILTTVTTVAGLLPTAYGILGYDSMLSDMMLAMSYGLMTSTLVTLFLTPALFYTIQTVKERKRKSAAEAPREK